MSDFVILAIGYIVVNLLSLIIAARVRKHLAACYALFTHAFVIFVAFYYCIDLIMLHRSLFIDLYFSFWIAIIMTQVLFIVYRVKKVKGTKEPTAAGE